MNIARKNIYSGPMLRQCRCSIEAGFSISGSLDFDDPDFEYRDPE